MMRSAQRGTQIGPPARVSPVSVESTVKPAGRFYVVVWPPLCAPSEVSELKICNRPDETDCPPETVVVVSAPKSAAFLDLDMPIYYGSYACGDGLSHLPVGDVIRHPHIVAMGFRR